MNNSNYNEATLAIELSKSVVNKRTGIIQECIEIMNENFDPKLYFYTTKMADTSKYHNFNKCHSNNGGAGITRNGAMAAAIGESIERYCSSIYDSKDLVYASYNELKGKAIEPERWALFSNSQYSIDNFLYKKYDCDTKINWVEGESLISNKKVYVPASFVYLPYTSSVYEKLISPCISTGLSAGISFESAVLGGIYEAVERDSISIMWLNKLSMPTINPYGGSRFLKNIIEEKIQCDNAIYKLIDITTDLDIPVIFSVKKFNSAKGKSASCGAACRLDPEQAALKAITEAAQGAKWIQYLHAQDWSWGYNDDFSDITEFQDHIHLYSLPEMVDKLDFVYKDNTFKDISTINNYSTNDKKKDLDACLSMLEDKGYDVIVKDVTSSDIEQIGYHVYKVLIPGLHQLQGNHNYPFLGGKRLKEVPKILGYKNEYSERGNYNKQPHPFP